VDKVYKGEVHATQSIVSASDGASCGLEVDPGAIALVFALNPDDGEYSASLCDGTRAASGGKLPVAFGPGTNPLPGSSRIGEDNSIPSLVVRNWFWLAGAAVLITGITVRNRRSRRSRFEQGSPRTALDAQNH
jgi:hypothetical protein